MLEINHLTKAYFSSARYGTCQFLSQFVFYQIHIIMTNECVSYTKSLMMEVKLMIGRYKKYSHKK